MVLAILIAATAWNLGTWLLGLPSSSSHTLIGAILGVGIVHCLQDKIPLGQGVNWHAAGSVGLSLLISPLIGFVCAGRSCESAARSSPIRPSTSPPPPTSRPLPGSGRP